MVKGPIDPERTIEDGAPDLERTIPAPAPVLGPGGYPVLPQAGMPPYASATGTIGMGFDGSPRPAAPHGPAPSIDTDVTVLPPRRTRPAKGAYGEDYELPTG